MERIRRKGWENRTPILTAAQVDGRAPGCDAHIRADAAARLAERDARDKLPDPRTPGDHFLGDPHPLWQSALAQAKAEQVGDAMLVGAAIGGALRRLLDSPDIADPSHNRDGAAGRGEPVRRERIRYTRQIVV